MVVIVVVVVVVVVIVVVVVVVAAVVVMVLLAATATGIYSPVAIWRQKGGVWAARLQKGFPQLGRRTLFSGSHWLGYDCSNLVSFHYMSKSTSTFAYIKLSHTITTKPHNDNLQFPSHKPPTTIALSGLPRYPGKRQASCMVAQRWVEPSAWGLGPWRYKPKWSKKFEDFLLRGKIPKNEQNWT